MTPNMTKENRAEIRALKGALKQVQRDDKRAAEQLIREMNQHEKAILRIDRQLGRQQFRITKVARKIENRIAILQGRLA